MHLFFWYGIPNLRDTIQSNCKGNAKFANTLIKLMKVMSDLGEVPISLIKPLIDEEVAKLNQLTIK